MTFLASKGSDVASVRVLERDDIAGTYRRTLLIVGGEDCGLRILPRANKLAIGPVKGGSDER